MDIKVLVKPEKETLEHEVEGYCESTYNDGSTRCDSTYRSTWTDEVENGDDDILFTSVPLKRDD